ncbi:MAG: flagellar filament capping protein FliD [Anaeromicrobium sp.]|jgi:flagellar hook-associated protein 2|uniref:flagellar filament capping protein FliD n=1 Tax=Anaeromicrobium sp. TaxID=1929132 RepID=UPI0025FF82F8|nr:flagellar filament capping protein FliD [Anaeromicrobium sp.]MCT4592707.1 flagellar filament capping protein FliD [Anaeromicrobium sp.]
MGSMRISGIASGMDTDTMVADLMKAERRKVDKIQQDKQLSVWRQEQYNDINKSISQFILDTRKDLFGTTSYYRTSDTLDWVNKATSSDESIFTANATTSAPTGTHTMKITQLAEGVNVGSTGEVQIGGKTAKSENTLSELGIADGKITFEIIVDGTTKEVDINYKGSDTIEEFVNKINNAQSSDGEPLGIQASFDDANGRLFLATKETGENSQIKVKTGGDTGGLLTGASSKFKMEQDLLDWNNGKKAQGQDAIIEFDGAKNLKYSSNTFSVNGIDINLNSKPANTGTEYTIKVDTDVDGVYDKIKGFVDKYNELIGKLNEKIAEKRYRKYDPLTKDQKKAMKENDIKLWEEKAKSGLLRNDKYIESLMQNVRSGLYEPVETDSGNLSPYDQLFDIGITTGEWKDKGKLVIDEKRLKDAIRNDGEGVMNLLFSPSDKDNSSKSGIVNRMYDDMIDGMKEIIDKSGTGDNTELYRHVKSTILLDFVKGTDGRRGSVSLIDEEISSFEKRIGREEARLIKVEGRYWAQFTAMEKAISEMQSQSSWLAGQM